MTELKKRVGLYTLGCKVSLYETSAISERFAAEGFEIAPFDSVCDVYVINTCTVTAESDAKSRKYIRRAIRKNPFAVVIVCGCYSQRDPDSVLSIDGVDAVVGTQDKLKTVEIAKNCLQNKEHNKINIVGSLDGVGFEPMRITAPDRTRAYVKIEDGCECKCSYCAIAPARGPVRSKPFYEVIDEVEALAARGTREVVLTGIETGSYGADLGANFGLCDLMEELDRRGSVARIRLGSMAPELMGEAFARRVMTLGIMVPHIHISMQSGADAVLFRMRRRYNAARALENIKRIKELCPGCLFTADLMVGFPGESEEDFAATLDFVTRAELLDAHVFAYSKRAGTPAAQFDGQISEEIKRRRSAALIEHKNRVRDGVLSRIVSSASPLRCIAETRVGDRFVGHSDSYVEVNFFAPDAEIGDEVFVIPERHENGVIFGKITQI